MIVALLVSTGSAWESRALGLLNDHPGIVVLKRCVDVDDLLATASAGQAEVAVVGAELPGLDGTVVDQLKAYDVRPVAITPDSDVAPARARRIGIETVLPVDRIDEVADAVIRRPEPVAAGAAPTIEAAVPAAPPPGTSSGRVIAVWGPAGAPGRTTVATAIAAELARRRLTTLLVDADPYGGAVAQQLGVLDEVSGLLAAARLAAGGSLDERFPTVQRRLSDHLLVLTGLPRPDRWVEVRPGVLTQVLERARADAQVVLDTGFSVEQEAMADPGVRPERNGLTVEALEAADEVVVVGSADPVGLARLARAVSDAHDLLGAPALRLVVNRMRPTLGWREPDVVSMLAGFGPNVGVHFLPDDQAAVDRALVAGRTLIESGESPLTRAVAGLIDAMARVRT
jgi:MinD-like ATPase involved in chromosome partitioning or flagellar assembly